MNSSTWMFIIDREKIRISPNIVQDLHIISHNPFGYAEENWIYFVRHLLLVINDLIRLCVAGLAWYFWLLHFRTPCSRLESFLDLQVLGCCNWNWKDEYFLSLPCSRNREIHIWRRSPFHTTLGHVTLMEVLLRIRVGTWAFDVGLLTQTLASCCS